MELTGLANILELRVVEFEFFGVDSKRNCARFAFAEADAAEVFKFFNRTNDATHEVADIELNDLNAVVVAVICYGNGGGDSACFGHFRLVERKVAIVEVGVAQAEAEGIKRFVGCVEIACSKFGEPFRLGSTCVILVVAHRALTDGARERGGKFAARSIVAKDNIGDSVGSFATAEPNI